MKKHMHQLLRGLRDRGWERVTITTTDLEWWADEIWTIRSVRERWGRELMLTFLVDPHWDQARKKGQAVHAIAATLVTPRDRSEAEAGIRLSLHHGRFDEGLVLFLDQLDDLRKGRFRQLRHYAEAFGSYERLVARFPDHTELQYEWDAAWRRARAHVLPPRVAEAGQELDALVCEVTGHRQSIEQLVARTRWPLVRAAAEALLEALDELEE